MTTFKSDFLNVLSSRGFVQQVSEPDALDALACEKAITDRKSTRLNSSH